MARGCKDDVTLLNRGYITYPDQRVVVQSHVHCVCTALSQTESRSEPRGIMVRTGALENRVPRPFQRKRARARFYSDKLH